MAKDINMEAREVTLPKVLDGEMATVLGVDIVSRKTESPIRYNEGSLLAACENAGRALDSDLKAALNRAESKGIGRPSTLGRILSEVADAYMEPNVGKKTFKFKPKPKAFHAVHALPPSMKSAALTAQWELKMDEIKTSADRAVFVDEIREDTSKMVEHILKLPPLEGAPSASVSRKNAPTDPMVNYAKKLAAAESLVLPLGWDTDFETCKRFLGEHGKGARADGPREPSPKSVQYAESIAKRKSLKLPAAALKDGKELSAWIDKHK